MIWGQIEEDLVGVGQFRAGGRIQRFEDYQKRRLVERVDILTAINILKSQGYDDDEIITEITRVFYVDLDEYNDLVRAA